MLNLTLDEFLAGPGRECADLDIDDIFGKEFEQVMAEIKLFDKNGLNPLDPDEGLILSDVVAGYAYQEVESGLALFAPDGHVVGGYFSCDLSIEYEHQGQGLGTELIVEYYVRNGCLPTWDLEVPAYSNAGSAAHRSAWEWAQSNPDLYRQKENRAMVPTIRPD